MKNLVVYASLFLLNSCVHPYFTQKRLVNDRSLPHRLNAEYIDISSFHFSAGQRIGSKRIISDTLQLPDKMDSIIAVTLKEYGFSIDSLVNESSLALLIDPSLRWNRRRLIEFMRTQRFEGNTMVPIVCYNVSLEPEKSGGGGIGPIYETGNDRYLIGQQIYIAYYENGELLYLRNISRWDEKIVPSGTPITHEFPQEVLDTLMHIALEPLLKQMEKGR
ncbi:MAG: hypothetical protein EA392_10495 [Cryomorphaceae bacterium]|nr:MAG: hypothetical protein EA392_10495 [Cryomorphaceae bacterium]